MSYSFRMATYFRSLWGRYSWRICVGVCVQLNIKPRKRPTAAYFMAVCVTPKIHHIGIRFINRKASLVKRKCTKNGEWFLQPNSNAEKRREENQIKTICQGTVTPGVIVRFPLFRFYIDLTWLVMRLSVAALPNQQKHQKEEELNTRVMKKQKFTER